VAWLREVPDQARHAGLANHADARALAALLDVLAAELPLWVPETVHTAVDLLLRRRSDSA
jgi:hypothetical protein